MSADWGGSAGGVPVKKLAGTAAPASEEDQDATYWRCVCWGPPLPRPRCPPARRLRGWPASERRGRAAACADSRTSAAWKTKGQGQLTAAAMTSSGSPLT